MATPLLDNPNQGGRITQVVKAGSCFSLRQVTEAAAFMASGRLEVFSTGFPISSHGSFSTHPRPNGLIHSNWSVLCPLVFGLG